METGNFHHLMNLLVLPVLSGTFLFRPDLKCHLGIV